VQRTKSEAHVQNSVHIVEFPPCAAALLSIAAMKITPTATAVCMAGRVKRICIAWCGALTERVPSDAHVEDSPQTRLGSEQTESCEVCMVLSWVECGAVSPARRGVVVGRVWCCQSCEVWCGCGTACSELRE
jgi:hypothetical protein